MRSAVSSSSVRDMWGDRRCLCFSCDLRCVSCGHFELIFADLLLKRVFQDSGSQPFPPFLGGSVQVRWVFFTEFRQCDSASWRVHTAVVPTRMVAMGTSLLCLRRSGSHLTLKALVSKLIYWRWVLIMDAMPLSKTVTLHVHNLLLLGSSRLDTQQLDQIIIFSRLFLTSLILLCEF